MRRAFTGLVWFFSILGILALAVPTALHAEDFIGPRPNWYNLKTDFGAVGDGVADDTAKLQAAVNALGVTRDRSVLYIPAGTYRLTDTVRMYKLNGIAILGENPATTILKWAGPTNSGTNYFIDNVGAMLLGQGSTLIRVGRLTFDGSTVASWCIRLRWGGYNSTDFFPSGNEFHDIVFKDSGVGIAAGSNNSPTGQDTAEYSHVVRCKFYRCTYAGMVTQEFNSLLWGVIDSYFEDNLYGVKSDTGVCNVYDSVFRRSKGADVSVGTTPFVSVRGCYSKGSQQFFTATQSTGVVTFQNNVVLDTVSFPIFSSYLPSLNLFGNTFRANDSALIDGQYCGLFAVNNRISGSSWFLNRPTNVAIRSLDNAMDANIVTPNEPVLPATPLPFTGPILVPSARTGAAVQAAITTAVATYAGLRPVVYLAGGDFYTTTATIVVPAGSDVQIIGDTPTASALDWTAGGAGPVLRLVGPSRARLQDFQVRGGYGSPRPLGLDITNADQVAGAVIFNQISVNSNIDTNGIQIQGVDRSKVEFIMPHYVSGPSGAFVISGGQLAAANSAAPPNVRCIDQFAGSGATGQTFQVSNGGRLILMDQWAETSNKQFLRLNGQANVTVSGGSFGFTSPPYADDPVISADGMSGRLNVIGLLLGGCSVRFSGNNPLQNALLATSALGGWGRPADPASVFDNRATAGTNKSIHTISDTLWFDSNPPNNTDISDLWLRTQMGDIINDSSSRLANPPAGSSAVLITRVDVALVDVGIKVSAPLVALAPAITTQPVNASVTVGQTATFNVTATGSPSPTYQWRKNGVALTGETAASYTTPPTVTGDSGAVFTVKILNTAGSVDSIGATLTVTGSTTGTTSAGTTTSGSSAGSGTSGGGTNGAGPVIEDGGGGGCGLGAAISLMCALGMFFRRRPTR